MSTDDKKFQDLRLKELEFQAHLEEYRAVRAEQRERIKNQQNAIYFLVILLAAILGVAASIYSLQFSEVKVALSHLLLLAPIFTTALCFLYLENDIMLIRNGRYISENLRKKVNRIVMTENMWCWEKYHVTESEKRKFTPGGGIPLFTRLIFMSSIFVPLIAFFLLVSPPYNIFQIILIVLDFTFLTLVLAGNIYIYLYFFEQLKKQPNEVPASSKLTNLYMKTIKNFIKKQEVLRAQKTSQLCGGFIKSGENVLDLGAGTGYIAKEIQKSFGVEITCVDIIDYNQTSLPLLLYDGENLPFKENIFDVVLLAFVLHHSNNPLNLLREVKRVLHQRASIIIFEDIYTNWLEYLITLIVDFFLNFPYRVKTPFNFKQESEWISIFKQLGLEIKHKKSVRVNKLDPVKHILFVVNKTKKCNIEIK